MNAPPRLVIDASVLVHAVASWGDAGDRARMMMSDHHLHGPEHLRVEAFSSIRGWVLGRKLDPDSGHRAVRRLLATQVQVVPDGLLFDRMWELRENLSAYDAAYVAAAEYLDVPLLTADRRLAAAPGVRCEVRLPA